MNLSSSNNLEVFPIFLDQESLLRLCTKGDQCRGGSRTAATSKMEGFLIIVKGWKPLSIITKRSILDVAAVLDPPLQCDLYSLLLLKL